MTNNYITATEYAEKLGISLDDVFAKVFRDEVKHKTQNGDTYIYYPNPEKEKNGNALISAEREKNEHLQQENAELKRTIENLKATIAEKDKQISDYAIRFADMATQAQQIASQAQYLQAAAEAPKRRGFFARLIGKEKSGQ